MFACCLVYLLYNLVLAACQMPATSIRLVGPGSELGSGIVQVNHTNRWRRVCTSVDFVVPVVKWSIQGGNAVCAQLRYGPALEVRSEGDRDTTDAVLCTAGATGIQNCTEIPVHGACYAIARVVCGSGVRLTGPHSSLGTGQVEIYHNGQWGSVCDSNWTIQDATVVCSELHYDSAVSASNVISAFVGQAVFGDVSCNGAETSLLRCRRQQNGSNSCNSSQNVAVTCKPGTTVRLQTMDGANSTNGMGRVVVKYQGTWGAICGKSWGTSDASVVCNQLGYGTALSSTGGSNILTTYIWLSNVQCTGNETRIQDCIHSGAVSSCDNFGGVVCSAYGIRLTGPQSEVGEGQVEIYDKGQWGSVCDSNWTIQDATVVCSHLHYESAVSASNVNSGSAGQAVFGDVSCNGSEPSLLNCTHPGNGSHSCTSAQNVAVQCKPGTTVRLAGVTSKNGIGRVEVKYQGTWGAICGNSWGTSDASVVCNQLGYGTAQSSTSNVDDIELTTYVWFSNVQCTGDETRIQDCIHSGAVSSCLIFGGVVCSAYGIRLTGPHSEVGEGQVEIYHKGQWGSVCDSNWTIQDATVVCSYIHYESAVSASNVNSGSAGQAVFGDVSCNGREPSLLNCTHPGNGSHSCTSAQNVAVQCKPGTTVRLAGVTSKNGIGRVEVKYQGTWGAICGKSWGTSDASVVCNQLGYGTALSSTVANFGVNIFVWLSNVQCTGNETRIQDCKHAGSISSDSCGNFGNVACSTYGIRLTGPQLELGEGQVEIYHKGQWGSVCDRNWTIQDATVVCTQLGYTGAVSARNVNESWAAQAIFGDVSCNGTETNLLSCRLPGIGPRSCNSSQNVAVECIEGATVQLVGPRSAAGTGRVEVKYRGVWGAVCSSDWGLNDARVVCAHLGYAYSAAQKVPIVGELDHSIWLDNVQCTGQETDVRNCKHNGVGVLRPSKICLSEPDGNGFSVQKQFVAGVRCQHRRCSDPGHSKFSSRLVTQVLQRDINSTFTERDTASWTCDTGFVLLGTSNATCQANGSWSSSAPICKQIQCVDPGYAVPGSRIINANLPRNNQSTYVFSDTVQWMCDYGYYRIGVANASCLANGSWSALPPVCEPTQCDDDPGYPVSGSRTVTSMFARGNQSTYVFRDTVHWTCNTGYKLNGNNTTTCEAHGQWSNTAPICQEILCQDFDPLQNGHSVLNATSRIYNVSRLSVGAQVYWSCATGYKLIGQRSAMCDIKGTWTHLLPVCSQIVKQATSTGSSNAGLVVGCSVAALALLAAAVHYRHKRSKKLSLATASYNLSVTARKESHDGIAPVDFALRHSSALLMTSEQITT